MFNNLELAAQHMREQHHDAITAATHDRMARACCQRWAITRRAAQPLGRALFGLGSWLLRFSKNEHAATKTIYVQPVKLH